MGECINMDITINDTGNDVLSIRFVLILNVIFIFLGNVFIHIKVLA